MLFEKNIVYFVPLGGSGEIGMNLNLYHYNGKWLMVDLGIGFEKEAGIEVVMPDIASLKPYLSDLVGLVVTHAHEDHIGAIAHLWQGLGSPFVFATPFVEKLLRLKFQEKRIKNPSIITTVPGKSWDLEPFSLEWIHITHSIPESHSLVIRTPHGTVFHTGDWKLDPNPLVSPQTDIKSLQKLGDEGVLAMVCDSTNALEEGTSGSEADVREELQRLVAGYPTSRVVITCFSSNIARLATCFEVAQATGRHVVVAGRSLEKMISVSQECGYLSPDLNFFMPHQGTHLAPEKTLLLCTGSQGEERAALMRIAYGKNPHLSITPQDVVFFSSRIIPGNEKAIHEVQNHLISQGAQVVTGDNSSAIHVSGHPPQEDLQKMYQWIRPSIAVPVHGDALRLDFHASLAKNWGVPHAFVPSNGKVIALHPQKGASCVGTMESGRLALDGHSLIPWNGSVMRQRNTIGSRGLIHISACIFSTGMDCQMTLLGVVESAEEEAFTSFLFHSLQRAYDKFQKEGSHSHKNLETMLRQTVIRAVEKKKGTKPVVTCHLFHEAPL